MLFAKISIVSLIDLLNRSRPSCSVLFRFFFTNLVSTRPGAPDLDMFAARNMAAGRTGARNPGCGIHPETGNS